MTPRERLIGAVDQIREDLRVRLAQLRDAGKLLEAQRLEQRTMFDMEMMQEVGYCAGIENYSRYLSGREPGEPPPCLFDYLPHDALLIVDESHQTIPQLGAMYKGDRSRKETLVEYGFRLPSALDNRPLKFEEWEQTGAADDLRLGDPRLLREVACRAGGGAGGAAHGPGRSRRSRCARCAPRWMMCCRRSTCAWRANERVLITVLTKRMAEDLTDYLHDHDVRVRYLHADIETVERTEIIRDLRLGRFDVLVGINLLREGLDMPEVSLVAILDADKEGFLRSDNSLIQTIGRAARNLNGRAILYADRVTGSMQRAMDETDRRRNKQMEFNALHGITPRGIIKGVADIMEGARFAAPQPTGKRRGKERADSAPDGAGASEPGAGGHRAPDQGAGDPDVRQGPGAGVRGGGRAARSDRKAQADRAGTGGLNLPLTFLNLAGSVALLLWGVHMVQTGVQRAFGAKLRNFLGRTLSKPFRPSSPASASRRSCRAAPPPGSW